MNWDEWVDFLEEFIGHGTDGFTVHLLVPQPGESDISDSDGAQLADAIHSRLFGGTYLTARDALRALSYVDVRRSLPLLYYCAWLARQQEDSSAFWPYFYDTVVRARLARQTVQQSLAPLITDLWWKAHREWGIYRPQEGPVHVKWPQAHAGLTEGEVDLVTTLLARSFGSSDEPPNILFEDPDELLAFLRIRLQFQSHVSRRLERLIFGPDGPALVAAELAQTLVRGRWPPPQATITVREAIRAPYLVLDGEQVRLSVVLPDGQVPDYERPSASCDTETTALEATFFQREDVTRYKPHIWPVHQIPWPRTIVLSLSNVDLDLRISPECPFTKSRTGALMFEAGTGRSIKRWRPNRDYLILLPLGAAPSWVDKLFVAIEVIAVGSVGDTQLQVLSGIGRDLIMDYSRQEAMAHLQELETELDRYGAMISLPDLADIYRPEILTCGGVLVADGRYPAYLTTEPPAIVVRNTERVETNVRLLKREDDGSERFIAAAAAGNQEASTSTVLLPPTLEEGSYVIRGTDRPEYFSLVAQTNGRSKPALSVEATLLHAEAVVPLDDIRHFEIAGIEIKSWPFARATLLVRTEAGTRSWTIRMAADGCTLVKAGDIEIPSDARWIEVHVRSWLAVSNPIRLAVRPYIAEGDWSIDGKSVVARVRGIEPLAAFEAKIVPVRPWKAPITEIRGRLDKDSRLRVALPKPAVEGWLIIMDSSSSCAWLITDFVGMGPEFSGDDLRNLLAGDFSLPSFLTGLLGLNPGLDDLISLAQLAHVARLASIPSPDEAVPEWLRVLGEGGLTGSISVRVPPNWGRRQAKLQLAGDSTTATLEIDGTKIGVRVLSSGRDIDIDCGRTGGLCICRHCDCVMTYAEWYSHRCVPSPSKLTALPQRFTLTVETTWPAAIDLVQRALLAAYDTGSEAGPPTLGDVWSKLQAAHRALGGQSEISPSDWITGATDGWKAVMALAQSPPENDWSSIWERLGPFSTAIVALAPLVNQ